MTLQPRGFATANPPQDRQRDAGLQRPHSLPQGAPSMPETAGLVPDDLHYTARRHAAVRTDDYVYAQFIPYIGNKRKLLPLIYRGLCHTGSAAGTFVDLFSGSTVVARFAKTQGYRVLANDWEP